MKVHSYTIVHYGQDYIGWAIRSVYPLVEQAHVLYTPTPSHGHGTNTPPIESDSDILLAMIEADPDKKAHWYEVWNTRQEGQHRDLAVSTCQRAGADLVVVLDCDEVWPAETLRAALDFVWSQNTARNWLINFTHLWRSFNWCCRDDAWPVRILDLRHTEGTGYVPRELGPSYHFGYAVTDRVMRYKWEIHGHKNELRPGWFAEKWAAWPPPPDCHPANERGYWNPEPFDKEQLPEFMRAHPFYPLERIE